MNCTERDGEINCKHNAKKLNKPEFLFLHSSWSVLRCGDPILNNYLDLYLSDVANDVSVSGHVT